MGKHNNPEIKDVNNSEILKKEFTVKKESRRNIGISGENLAVQYLLKKHYKILARNFRFGRIGEIDIIAVKNEYICFIEVKTRSSCTYGLPSEAVNSKKQNKIICMASMYIDQFNLHGNNIRFDVIEIILENANNFLKLKTINHIENAFQLK